MAPRTATGDARTPLPASPVSDCGEGAWCRRRDSNSHALWAPPPQDGVSTSSTTSAQGGITCPKAEPCSPGGSGRLKEPGCPREPCPSKEPDSPTGSVPLQGLLRRTVRRAPAALVLQREAHSPARPVLRKKAQTQDFRERCPAEGFLQARATEPRRVSVPRPGQCRGP